MDVEIQLGKVIIKDGKYKSHLHQYSREIEEPTFIERILSEIFF